MPTFFLKKPNSSLTMDISQLPLGLKKEIEKHPGLENNPAFLKRVKAASDFFKKQKQKRVGNKAKGLRLRNETKTAKHYLGGA